VNSQGYDRSERLEEQTLLSAVCKPLVPLLNFFTPPKNAQEKRGRDPKKSRKLCFRTFMTSPIARSKGSPRTRPGRELQDMLMPDTRLTTRLNFSGMSTRLSCFCVSGFPSQTASRRGNRNSFRDHFKMRHCGHRVVSRLAQTALNHEVPRHQLSVRLIHLLNPLLTA
jgi:hypothetical protein